ncbi:MAG: hypothetical protein A4E32_01600 [Methanomassiliicoccales archaeon PtaU1.Bin124]|nr:MAG: hypothetical protein A4E32_01600 [Methanomassiliicoccales archaeon PtaU1.Bin124]
MEQDIVDGERISLRLEPEDLELIDSFVEQHPEFSNRSHLARMALRAFIEKDGAKVSAPSSGNRVTVALAPRLKNVIDQLIDEGELLDWNSVVQDALQRIYMSKRMDGSIDKAHEKLDKIEARM